MPQVETLQYRPFDPVSKRAEASVREASAEFRVTKGAPQVVLDLCAEDSELRDAVHQAVEELAGHGFRALGVAKTDSKGDWRFLALLPFFDPPREDSAETLERAGELGVHSKMITGDHLAIAKEVARRLGMGSNVLTADFLSEHGRDVSEQIERADGVAQVFPEHKHRIVGALQSRGHYVGMTGDGVNDAPALKKADIGIAVEGATEAARSAADLILTEPGLGVIVRAIEAARRIFVRMTSYATYRIAETLRVLLFMTASILIFNFYPVTAVMIILLALLNDLPIMMIAYDQAKVADRPLRWDMRKVTTIATTLGVVGVIETFLLLVLAEHTFHLDRTTIQTLIFLKLSVAGHMTIYVARTAERPFWRRPHPSWLLVLVSEGTQVLATLVAVFGIFMAPISWKLALFIWGYAIVWVFLEDRAKVYAYRIRDAWGKGERKQVNRHMSRLHPAHHMHGG
jgi:H+-transporting ATPase